MRSDRSNDQIARLLTGLTAKRCKPVWLHKTVGVANINVIKSLAILGQDFRSNCADFVQGFAMGRHANDTTIEVHDGVYLKLVGKFYQCYFRIDGKQFRQSAKTGDLMAAKLFALNFHGRTINKFQTGESVDQVSFSKLKRTYVAHIRALASSKLLISTRN